MTKYKEYIVSYSPTFKRAADLSVVYYSQLANDGYFLVCSLGEYLYETMIIEPSDLSDFGSNYLPYATGLQSKDDAIAFAIINESFSQIKYDIQGSVIYTGKAAANALTSEAKWTILKVTLDGSGNPIARNSTKQYLAVWNDRATETYY